MTADRDRRAGGGTQARAGRATGPGTAADGGPRARAGAGAATGTPVHPDAPATQGPETPREDLQAWMRWQPTASRGPLSALELAPARLVVGIGAALAVIGGLMPWAEGVAPGRGGFEPVFFSGTGGAGDGVVVLLTALGAGFLTLHRSPATSRVRTIRLLPAVLVTLAAFSWLNGFRAAGLEVEAWERRGGTGGMAPGMWLAAAGIGLMAIGTAWLLPAVIRWQAAHGDPSDLVELTAGGVARVVAAIVGTIVGGALGISLTVDLTPTPLIGLIALGAVFGGLGGLYAGAWLAGLVVDRDASPR